MFRLEDEQGRWLTNMQLNAPGWKPGDRIPRGRDTSEVMEVRLEPDQVTLVVKRVQRLRCPVVPSPRDRAGRRAGVPLPLAR
jgi:hypothetical protein